jgi:outer membrane protein assembly factor BamB
MKIMNRCIAAMLICLAAAVAGRVSAQDWPQWRGANRDGKATGFKAPASWPQDLTEKWKAPVGSGDASPAVVGDKLYVFSRDDKGEVTLCLDAATGKELWRDTVQIEAAKEPMGKHPGPRSSPTVADGKVLDYGVRGTLSCLDAASGKVLWRKNDTGGTYPRFFTSSSPLVADGLCIAQMGGEENGGIFAYALASGDQKWSWTDDGSAYASPSLMVVDGTKMVVALTSKRLVGLSLTDGKFLWEAPFAPAGRAYNAATPIVDGATVIFAGSGRGTKAVKIAKASAGFEAKELWSNAENAVQFNTPVLKEGRLYGISQKGDLFCLSASDGKSLWTAPLGMKDFGTVVDAGPVLMAMGTQGELNVFEPSATEFKKVANYKVAKTETYAYPVPVGEGILVKDKDSLAYWSTK